MDLIVREFAPEDEPAVQSVCRAAYMQEFKVLSADWRPRVVRMLEERIIGRGLQDIAPDLRGAKKVVAGSQSCEALLRAGPTATYATTVSLT